MQGIRSRGKTCIISSNVPNRAEGWEDDFKVPTQFSQSTMAVLASGQMTKSARTEIVQATPSKMLNFCKYPTTPQHEVIRKKIVANILHGRKDTTESGYVSHQYVGECSLCSLTDCRAHGEQL